MTQSLPEVIEIIKRNVSAKAVILEGEVIALDNAGYPILFQHLMCRFKRLHGIGDMALKIPLALYIFDVLYLNGKSLIKLPYFERRHILSQNVGEIPLTKQIITDKPVHAASFLEEAIVNGHEGLMAKKQTAFTHLDEEEDVG